MEETLEAVPFGLELDGAMAEEELLEVGRSCVCCCVSCCEVKTSVLLSSLF